MAHCLQGFVSAKSAAADDLYSDQSDLDTAKLQQIERTFRDILRRKKSSAQGAFFFLFLESHLE